MASIFDVAIYILHQHGPMSPMKLQKLCYYCQAWSLVWDDQELFPEEFEAWRSGPVCRELASQTQGLSLISRSDLPGDPDTLTENQKETIDQVLAYYAPHDAQWLGRLAQMEDPWTAAETQIQNNFHDTVFVTKDSMARYYSTL